VLSLILSRGEIGVGGVKKGGEVLQKTFVEGLGEGVARGKGIIKGEWKAILRGT